MPTAYIKDRFLTNLKHVPWVCGGARRAKMCRRSQSQNVCFFVDANTHTNNTRTSVYAHSWGVQIDTQIHRNWLRAESAAERWFVADHFISSLIVQVLFLSATLITALLIAVIEIEWHEN